MFGRLPAAAVAVAAGRVAGCRGSRAGREHPNGSCGDRHGADERDAASTRAAGHAPDTEPPPTPVHVGLNPRRATLVSVADQPPGPYPDRPVGDPDEGTVPIGSAQDPGAETTKTQESSE